jgi:Mrp family chromosome partitioning ATPase/capsular polysaccharide biosynthesis protein
MELWQAFSILKRRWPLILALVLLATSLAAASVLVRRPVYRATATINTGAGQRAEWYSTNVQLADMQAVLLSRYLLTKLDEQVQLNRPLDDIEEAIRVSRLGESGVLRIDVLWPDAQKAQEAANTLADLFIDYQSGQLRLQAQRETTLLESQVDLARQRVERAQANRPAAAAPADPAVRAAEEELLAARQNFFQTVNKLELARATANNPAQATNLTIIDRATVPLQPEPNNLLRTLVFGALLGSLVGGSLAIGAEYLNPVPRFLNVLENKLGAPILAAIPWERRLRGRFKAAPQALSPERRDAFRTLCANLLLGQGGEVERSEAWRQVPQPRRPLTILVISDRPSSGASSVVVHLGAALATAGKSVVLVDGNLLDPSLHQFLENVPPEGLDAWLADPQRHLEPLIQPTDVPNLHVLPSPRPNSAAGEWLVRRDLRRLVETLGNWYDVVILDSPALDRSGDARMLSAAADGLLLVMRPGGGKDEERARRLLQFAGEKLLGVVLNGVALKGGLATSLAPQRALRPSQGVYDEQFTLPVNPRRNW